MVKKIVLVNPKGGSGKTTIAINLAAHYAASGRRVTLVDLDPQGSSSRWLAKRPDSSQHIHGIAGFNTPTGVTRSFVMAIPPEIERIVVDTPTGLSGQQLLQPRPRLRVSICDLVIRCDGKEASGTLTAMLGSLTTSAEIASQKPTGAGLSINLEDIELENQRYRWRQNVLEIAARHPSLKRYLGDKEHGFPGQETKHFRLLVAEVVADAVCGLLVRRNVQANPDDYEDADWDTYYAQYTKYMTQFLPIAHKIVVPAT